MVRHYSLRHLKLLILFMLCLALEVKHSPRRCGKHPRLILCHLVSFFVQVWLTTHAFLVTTFKVSYLLQISGSIEDVALKVLTDRWYDTCRTHAHVGSSYICDECIGLLSCEMLDIML